MTNKKTSNIHPTAIVAPEAKIGEGTTIGAYSVIGPKVQIGDKTTIMPHVFIDGLTTIGNGCTVFSFASLGNVTQDMKYKGGNPGVIIGDETTIREYVTVNAATDDGNFTRVGSKCLIMAYAHVAHDCVVGNEVIIANSGTLAGHIEVESQAVIGGLCGIHQFVRIGRMCMIGGCSKITKDIPPFMLADGNPIEIHGINSVGLKRRGIPENIQHDIKQAFKLIYRQGLTVSAACKAIKEQIATSEEIQHILAFLEKSERGLAR